MRFIEAIRANARQVPDRPAVRSKTRECTHRELAIGVGAYAAELEAHGISSGDRVLLVLPNSVAFVQSFHAVLAMGGVVVPAHHASASRELSSIIDDCAPTAVLTTSDSLATVERAMDSSRNHPRVLIVDADGRSPIEASTPSAHRTRTPGPASAVLLYTSGTSGAPRGVLFSEARVFDNVCAAVEVSDLHDGDTLLLYLSMTHSFGQNIGMNAAITAGASMSLLDRFDPKAIQKEILTGCITHLYGVPSTFESLLRNARLFDDAPSLRHCLSAGDRLAESTALAWQERAGLPLHQGYGLTEAGLVARGRSDADVGTCGGALRGVSIEISCPGSHGVPGAGEIVVTGSGTMTRYWSGDPSGDRSPITDQGSQVRTGDLGWFDSAGRLHLESRLKSMIKVNGVAVMPEEVEFLLQSHPWVAEAHVYGAPNALTGAIVCADIVPVNVDVTADDLRRFCLDHLAPHKVPVTFRIVKSVSRNALGKRLRRDGGELQASELR